jgi:formylglycine-generating enzyme required for sulfatase activity
VKSYPANGYGLYDMAGNVWSGAATGIKPIRIATSREGSSRQSDWPGEELRSAVAPSHARRKAARFFATMVTGRVTDPPPGTDAPRYRDVAHRFPLCPDTDCGHHPGREELMRNFDRSTRAACADSLTAEQSRRSRSRFHLQEWTK